MTTTRSIAIAAVAALATITAACSSSSGVSQNGRFRDNASRVGL